MACVLGGGLIGFLMGSTLIIENGECGREWKMVLTESLMWGLIGGGLGSTVCSRKWGYVCTNDGPAGLVARGDGAAEPVFEGEKGGRTRQ
jgi:uncharacterized membrane protein